MREKKYPENSYTVLHKCKTYECSKGHRFHFDPDANDVEGKLVCPVCNERAEELGVVGQVFPNEDDRIVTAGVEMGDVVYYIAEGLDIEEEQARKFLDKETLAKIATEIDKITGAGILDWGFFIDWEKCLKENPYWQEIAEDI